MQKSTRHLASHWLVYLMASLVIGMLVVDFAGLVWNTNPSRVSSLGLVPLFVPALLVCMALWAVGMRLDAARRELDLLRTELERAQTLGRTGNWSNVGGRFSWSQRAQWILGIEPSDLGTFEQLIDRVAVEDRAPLERAWRAAQAGAHHRAEFCITGADGERRLLFEGRTEPGADDPRLAGIVQDMTDRYRMERELRRAMRYQRALLDNFPFMVWLKDRDLRFLAVNKPLARAGGLNDPDDACGLQDHDLWPARLADTYRSDDLDVLDSRASRCTETVIDTESGQACFEIWKAPVLDDGGELLGTVGFARDISERKRGEDALSRSHGQLATLGRLQARFIRGETGDALFSSMLDVLFDLSGCTDGFLAEVTRGSRDAAKINLLAGRDTDWLNERADLIDVALQADGRDCESGTIVASAADVRNARGLVCIAVMSERRLIGLIGLASSDGRITQDALVRVQAAVSTFGLILQAGEREQARQHAEAELKLHRDRLTGLVEDQLSDSASARRLAEHANRAKSRFLASMSHELRTPIHAILSFSRIALRNRPPLADATRRHFEVIRENGDRLLSLVDDLLDLSRLESGQIRLNKVHCDLAELVGETVAGMEAIAVERGICLTTAVSAAGTSMAADAQRLSQVLRKLLDNAIRFSPINGEVVLTLERHDDAGRSGVMLSVCDYGPGIPEADRERVFDQFDQASRIRGATGGTGLGLAICREIVSLHGGWIRATEREKCGTCIELWLAEDAPAHQQAVASAQR